MDVTVAVPAAPVAGLAAAAAARLLRCAPGRFPTRGDTTPGPGRPPRRNPVGRPVWQCDAVGILSWIAVGLVAGLIARWIVRDDRSGCIYTIVVGVLGALIGGWLMQANGKKGVDDFDLRAVLVAAVGAVLFLLVLQAVGGRAGKGRGRRTRR